ncbi:MAG: PilZ domain-containing protein [Candidatus Coatesbacteria bacterium]|nr:PilZ domain-containing protein [Candidatus Coatesbacteria bacterium]
MNEESRLRTFSEPDNVKRLLARAQSEGLALDVRIEAFTLRFSSRFSAQTDLEKQHLVLESMSPDYGNELLSSNRFISISFTTGDFRIFFSTQFEKGWRENKEWFWQIAFPESVELGRTRVHSRVEPPSGERLAIYFVVEDDAILGNVVDISSGGALFVSKVREPTLAAGMTIEGMELKLPGRNIKVDARIVRIAAMNCAVSFTAVREDDRRVLQEYIERRAAEIRRGFAV